MGRQGKNVLCSIAGLFGLALAGCASGADMGPGAWDPVDDGGTSGGSDESSGDESGDGGSTTGEPTACEPGDTETCLCDDGVSLGEHVCNADGSAWGACDCGGAATTGPDTGGEPPPDDSGGEEVAEVCYPGPDQSGTTCFELHYFEQPPTGYSYPEPYQGDPNYRKPIAYIDLDQIDPATKLAPNFRLDEIAQSSKGRWAIVQPHAVVSLQGLRDKVGAIGVNSGYRSPSYNQTVGGATHSRHMFGDGFDLNPLEVGLTTLENECVAAGGQLVEYTSHVHCDFRFDAVSEEFFGAAGEPGFVPGETFEAEIESDNGVYTATVSGFDEGEPTRRWRALDAEGVVIAEGLGPIFIPPFETATVEVEVGKRIEVARSVD